MALVGDGKTMVATVAEAVAVAETPPSLPLPLVAVIINDTNNAQAKKMNFRIIITVPR